MLNNIAVLINTNSNIYKHQELIEYMAIPWNKGQINKIVQICKLCSIEHLEWPTVKPDFCSRECYYKFKIGKESPLKGIKLSQLHKEKISKGLKGHKPWNKGKKGLFKHSEEWKQKLRKRFIENNPIKKPEVLEKIRKAQLGKKYSEETNKKKSMPLEKNPNWKGGKTKEWQKFKSSISSKLAKWARDVKKRDNFTCQECGCKEKEILQAHHKKFVRDYPELILNLSNGETLCELCHIEKTRKMLKK